MFSRTLRQSDYDVVQALREEEGKDIWLFGGGSLFRSLAEAGFVDTLEVAIIPIVLGGGIPLVAEPAARVALTLQEHTVYAKTGTVFLVYAVNDAVQVTGRVIESRTSKHRAVRSGSPLLPVPTGHLLVEAAIDGVATRVT